MSARARTASNVITMAASSPTLSVSSSLNSSSSSLGGSSSSGGSNSNTRHAPAYSTSVQMQTGRSASLLPHHSTPPPPSRFISSQNKRYLADRTRAIRLGLLRPGSLLIALLITLVYREYLHASVVYSRVPVLRLPPSKLTLADAKAKALPLLMRSAPNDALPDWQTKMIVESGAQLRRNPLVPREGLRIDDKLHFETTTRTTKVGEQLVLDFYCEYEDDEIEEHCPAGYRVWFVGPSIFSPTFSESSEPIGTDGRGIRVTLKPELLVDPGNYEVFAWPEHNACDQWNHGDVPIAYHRLAVKGSPLAFTVSGELRAEGSELCASTMDVSRGRWISRAHIEPSHYKIDSSHWWWLSTQMIPTSRDVASTFYSYIWVPFTCKKPHHSYREWIDILRPSSLLIIGDSVLRDAYCLIIYGSLGGDGSDGRGGGEGKMCQWPKDPADVQYYHTSPKSFAYTRPDGNVTSTAFAWVPNGSATDLATYFDKNPSTSPSHISFGVSLWLANDSPEVYAKKIRPAIELLVKRFPEARINIRTSATTVQAISCYDRIGGQRRQMEANNVALLELLQDYPTVNAFDVYSIFNDRPEATSDGRHWGAIGAKWSDRPETGAAEFAVSDEMFFSWLSWK